MVAASRNLTFKSHDLGKAVTLLLCFSPPASGQLYHDQFPVAWKVTGLADVGNSKLDVTWTQNLAIGAAQVGQGSIVKASHFRAISVGQETELRLKGGPPAIQYWTEPKASGSNGKLVRGINNTGDIAGIGIGFIANPGTDHEDMSVALIWPEVGNTHVVTCEFTPILKAYIALGYQENEVLKGAIEQMTPLWEKNLLHLKPNTTLVVRQAGAGEFEIVQVDAAN